MPGGSAPRSASRPYCIRRLRHDPPPHVHAIVPGGGLSEDGTVWIACRPQFFLPVRLLSRQFRRPVIEMLLAAQDVGSFAAFLARFRTSEWVVVGACWGMFRLAGVVASLESCRFSRRFRGAPTRANVRTSVVSCRRPTSCFGPNPVIAAYIAMIANVLTISYRRASGDNTIRR